MGTCGEENRDMKSKALSLSSSSSCLANACALSHVVPCLVCRASWYAAWSIWPSFNSCSRTLVVAPSVWQEGHGDADLPPKPCRKVLFWPVCGVEEPLHS